MALLNAYLRPALLGRKRPSMLFLDHGRIKSLAGHTVYAYSSGLRAVQFLLRNYATRVDKKGIAPEQGFILLVI